MATPPEPVGSPVLDRPLGSTRSALALALALPASALVALAISAQTYLSMLGHGHSLSGILGWQLSCWLLWALAAPPVVRAAERVSDRRNRAHSAWRPVVLLGLVLVPLHIVLAAQLSVWFRPFLPVAWSSLREALPAQLVVLLPLDLLAFGSLALAGWITGVARRARALKARESVLEGELAKAQLETLRLEIRPHFLFNTLNSITALIRSHENAQALSMLLGLGDLLRDTLDHTRRPMVTVADEIRFTERYVQLQQARFGERLAVRFEIDPACAALAIPTFVLQPLVENALRHGTAGRRETTHVDIGAAVDPSGGLRLWVEDDGPGLPTDFRLGAVTGTGLRNTLARLERVYGDRAALQVGPRRGGGTVSTIKVAADEPPGVPPTHE